MEEFPEVGQKQKTEKKKKEERKLVITMAKLRMAHASRLGQFYFLIYLNPKQQRIVWLKVTYRFYRIGIIQKLLQHVDFISGVSLNMKVLNAETLQL